MRVVIFGGSGLVGTYLKDKFESVKVGVRDLSKVKEGTFYWDPITGQLDPAELEGADAVINLAGDNIVSLRWSESKKKELYESRIRSTSLIVNTINKMSVPPTYLFNASGINYYGNCGDQIVTETSPPGKGFLASVAQKWEATARQAEGKTNVVLMRFGLILSRRGGFLKKILMPFELCLGGKLGTGQQWMSWLALDEMASIIRHIYDHQIKGPVNFVSPNPVQNAEFTRILSAHQNRPAFLNLSEQTLRTLLGEVADEMMLISLRVQPKVLLDSNYQFKYPDLQSVLKL